MLVGSGEHGDSLSNKGKITGRGAQWMTAGSGILHQATPKDDMQGRLPGFQLWAIWFAGELVDLNNETVILYAQIIARWAN